MLRTIEQLKAIRNADINNDYIMLIKHDFDCFFEQFTESDPDPAGYTAGKLQEIADRLVTEYEIETGKTPESIEYTFGLGVSHLCAPKWQEVPGEGVPGYHTIQNLYWHGGYQRLEVFSMIAKDYRVAMDVWSQRAANLCYPAGREVLFLADPNGEIVAVLEQSGRGYKEERKGKAGRAWAAVLRKIEAKRTS